MNTVGLIGVLIRWNTPLESRDYSNLKDTDFEIISMSKPCPVSDGSPISFAGADGDYEWLVKKSGTQVTGYDSRLYVENIASRPTNVKSDEYTNYNVFLTEYQIVRRSNEEIISVIKQIEEESNANLLKEAGGTKIVLLGTSAASKQASGVTLTDEEQNVLTRSNELSTKCMQNAANAEALIAIVNAGGNLDLDSGWKIDNITEVGTPFNS